MTDVVISCPNQLYAKFHCDSGIARELWEEFAFFVPGYKYMPAFKKGWDGKARLFNMKTRCMYRGLLPKAIAWLKENNYSIEIENKDDLRPKLKWDKEWLLRQEEYFKFNLFDHQEMGISGALSLNQALILSPTGSGKSGMIYMICRWLLENMKGKILVTVPSTSLVEQLTTDFEDYAVGNWTAEDNVHRIYSGKEKHTNKRIVISTWQSARLMPAEWFHQFEAYLCDEAHGADSKCITAIIDNMAHAPVRIGLTGTLDGTVMHELEMLGRFGPVVKTTTSKDLMDKGLLADLNIDAVVLEYSDEERKLVHGADYQDEINFLVNHKLRNNFIINTALSQKGNVLMLFNFIEKHGKVLFDKLNTKAQALGRKVYYIDGATAVDSREEIRRILERETDCIVLASFGTTSVGWNVKNIDVVMFCHPYKSKIRVLQSIGRGLRAMAGKLGVKLIDIGDDLVYKARKTSKGVMNSAMKHFIERLSIYEKENFKYKIIKLQLR